MLDLDDLLGDCPTTSPERGTEAQLAAFWGVTARQVRVLVSEGVIAKSEAGIFELQASTRAYLRHLMAKANRKTASPELAAEKLRLTREQADAIEIKNAAARGDLVPASEVKNSWFAILRDVRAGMLAIPSRVQTRLPSLSAHEVKIIDSEIREILKETASG